MRDAALEKLLLVAEKTAVSAATLLREKWAQPRQLTAKGFRDLVTDADYASQALITSQIRQAFPEHGFLTEEEASDLPDSGSIIWVIDPVDGTTNYSRQIPIFTVAIAAVDSASREVVVGVILDPMRQELFSAAKGQGVWLQVEKGEKRPLSARSSNTPTAKTTWIILSRPVPKQPPAMIGQPAPCLTNPAPIAAFLPSAKKMNISFLAVKHFPKSWLSLSWPAR